MLPYNANDVLRVMRYELASVDERRLGEHLARDVCREDDRSNDSPKRHDRGGRTSPLALLRSLVLLVSA